MSVIYIRKINKLLKKKKKTVILLDSLIKEPEAWKKTVRERKGIG